MKDVKLNSLFSIPLMEFDYGKINEDENKIIEHYLKDLVPNQNYGNFHTKEVYILDKALPDLKNFFEEAIKIFVKNVIVGDNYDNDDLNFRITQSWINLLKPSSGGHHTHNHANSIISGVFYIKANPKLDTIVFDNHMVDYHNKLHIGVKKYNIFNSESMHVPVKTGKLLLFPSYLYHGVKPTQGKEDRVSMSFNAFPYGTIGRKEDLTELRIQ